MNSYVYACIRLIDMYLHASKYICVYTEKMTMRPHATFMPPYASVAHPYAFMCIHSKAVCFCIHPYASIWIRVHALASVCIHCASVCMCMHLYALGCIFVYSLSILMNSYHHMHKYAPITNQHASNMHQYVTISTVIHPWSSVSNRMLLLYALWICMHPLHAPVCLRYTSSHMHPCESFMHLDASICIHDASICFLFMTAAITFCCDYR